MNIKTFYTAGTVTYQNFDVYELSTMYHPTKSNYENCESNLWEDSGDLYNELYNNNSSHDQEIILIDDEYDGDIEDIRGNISNMQTDVTIEELYALYNSTSNEVEEYFAICSVDIDLDSPEWHEK